MMDHRSINNSVLLTSTGLARSHQSSVEPRLFVSNNDRSVKVYDVAVRSGKGEGRPRLVDAGQLKLDVPINHCAHILYVRWLIQRIAQIIFSFHIA